MYHDFPHGAKFRVLGNSEKVSRIVEVVMQWKKTLAIRKLL